ncbi:MAG: bifunctional diaminohydroxyphosphoribosylaminopyrimidine deaminase/5-amino-6-(5-phosphoribosylamino)uracil reductase RibD [Phycisphaerae bacterium]
MPNEDERHMLRALELARRGTGAVEPNPPVGAVLVAGGEAIGSGWHRHFGGPHAEVEALRSAQQAGNSPRGATLYVTLEPCSHHGKTPPCTEAIISAEIARVVIAVEDPDTQVSGRGVEALRAAGIEVEVGVCADEARELLAAYIKTRTVGRPWVICKWAQTADGYLAVPDGRWVSGPVSRAEVHRLRGICDGVLVGLGTVLADDPLLTNRSGRGRKPARLVLDGDLEIPPDCRLVQTAAETPVIVATCRQSAESNSGKVRKLTDAGVEVLPLEGSDRRGSDSTSPALRVDLEQLLDELGRRRWTRLLVEGGAEVLDSFLSSAQADEVIVFVSPRRLGEEAGGLTRYDIADAERAHKLRPHGSEQFGGDTMLTFRCEKRER